MGNLKEICLILDELYKKPPQRIPRRWLSTFDCAETLIHMLNFLLVLYFAFMPEKCDNECSREMYRQEYRQIHKTHDKLVEVFRNFLACFMKYEKIRNIRSKKLKRIKIDDSSIRDVETFFCGGKNKRLMKEMCAKKRNDIAARF